MSLARQLSADIKSHAAHYCMSSSRASPFRADYVSRITSGIHRRSKHWVAFCLAEKLAPPKWNHARTLRPPEPSHELSMKSLLSQPRAVLSAIVLCHRQDSRRRRRRLVDVPCCQHAGSKPIRELEAQSEVELPVVLRIVLLRCPAICSWSGLAEGVVLGMVGRHLIKGYHPLMVQPKNMANTCAPGSALNSRHYQTCRRREGLVDWQCVERRKSLLS